VLPVVQVEALIPQMMAASLAVAAGKSGERLEVESRTAEADFIRVAKPIRECLSRDGRAPYRL
jgi:hypothetical protein